MASSSLFHSSTKRPHPDLSPLPSGSPSKRAHFEREQGDITTVAQSTLPPLTPPSAALTQVSAATSPANPDIQNIARENLGSTTETTQLERDKASAEQFFRSGEENLCGKKLSRSHR